MAIEILGSLPAVLTSGTTYFVPVDGVITNTNWYPTPVPPPATQLPDQSTPIDKLTSEVTLIDELIAKIASLEEKIRELKQALGTETYTISTLSAAEVIHCLKYGTRQLREDGPHQEPKKEIDYLGEIRAMIEG